MAWAIGYYKGKETSLMVSTGGYVVHRDSGIEASYSVNSAGYLCVAGGIRSDTTYRDGRLKFDHKSIFVHRLVAYTFLPRTILADHINHIDMNKHNNRLENLEWVTRSENTKKMYEVESIQNTSRGGYSVDDILYVCHELSLGKAIFDISKETEMPIEDIEKIRKHEIGNDISANFIFKLPEKVAREHVIPISNNYVRGLGELHYNAIINDDIAHKICKIYQDGGKPLDAMKATLVNKNICESIYSRKTWTHISSNYTWYKKPDYSELYSMIALLIRHHWKPMKITNLCWEASGLSKDRFLALVYYGFEKYYTDRKKGRAKDKFKYYSDDVGFDPIGRTREIFSKINGNS